LAAAFDDMEKSLSHCGGKFTDLINGAEKMITLLVTVICGGPGPTEAPAVVYPPTYDFCTENGKLSVHPIITPQKD